MVNGFQVDYFVLEPPNNINSRALTMRGSEFNYAPVLLILVSLLFFACSRSTDKNQPASDEMAVEAGRLIASESFEELSGHLGAALKEGGVSHAIEFCSVEAIPITQKLSNEFNVDIKRATHKPRNPENFANADEMKIIQVWQEQMESGEEISPVASKTNSHYQVYAPIRIGNQLCLQCHGDKGTDIQPENVELLQSLYNEDRATGFEMGDLRGLWSIRMPADSAEVAAIISMVNE